MNKYLYSHAVDANVDGLNWSVRSLGGSPGSPLAALRFRDALTLREWAFRPPAELISALALGARQDHDASPTA